jgi:anti-sigma-K factor RskA
MAMACDDVRPLLDQHVCGGLDADDEARVARHIESCSACRAEAAAWEETFAVIPSALSRVDPVPIPESLEGRLLERLDSVQPRVLIPPASTAPVTGRSRRRLWARVAAVVTVALALFSLGLTARLNSALGRERSLRNELAAQLGEQQVVIDVVDSPRSSRLVLKAVLPGSTAYGKLYVRSDLSNVVVMAGRLPPRPPGSTYAVWVTEGTQSIRAGSLTTNNEGFGLLVFDAGRNGPSYDVVRIVVQPLSEPTPNGMTVLSSAT